MEHDMQENHTPKAAPVSVDILMPPHMAKHYRETKHFERQRVLSPRNIERLAEKMRRGSFNPGTQIYLAVLPGGVEIILNGNHTLEAIVASGVPQWITVTRYSIADLDEAGRLYAGFDDHSRRTLAAILVAAGITVRARNPSIFGAAVSVIMSDFLQRSNGANEKGDIATEAHIWEEPADDFEVAIAGCSSEIRKYCNRAPVMAVGLVTFKYQPSAAYEFWQRLAADSGLTEGVPQRSLLRYFRNGPDCHGPARATMARATALAWNAAFRGARLQLVRPESLSTFTLVGTPWERGITLPVRRQAA